MSPLTPSAATLSPNTGPAETAGSSPRAWSRRFYLLLTLVLIGIVLKGFWPSYFGPMFGGASVPRAWVMHLHGAIFTGWILAWVSPMLAGMAFDRWARRRVHPVYWISLAAMTLAFVRIFFMESAGWLTIGRALLTPFL